jgi:IMP dehydrogenase
MLTKNGFPQGPYSYTFDDVMLVPQYSDIASRSDVSSGTLLLGIALSHPIVAANMDSCCGPEMVKAMWKTGGLGILHRYTDRDTIVGWVKDLTAREIPAIVSIGVKPEDVDNFAAYYEAGSEFVCIDVAHGDSKASVQMVENIAKIYGGVRIVAGNVCTYGGACRLVDAGANTVKVGVGPGQICSTRIQTGHGVPQLSAIADVVRVRKVNPNVTIIADGGVRASGDIVKCLAFGADAVMCGGLLAGALESPGSVLVGPDGSKYKIYRGQASREAQMDFKGKVSNDTPEGVSITVSYKGPVDRVIAELVGGIRSGLTYSGVSSIMELQENAMYTLITGAGYVESTPHGQKK